MLSQESFINYNPTAVGYDYYQMMPAQSQFQQSLNLASQSYSPTLDQQQNVMTHNYYQNATITVKQSQISNLAQTSSSSFLGTKMNQESNLQFNQFNNHIQHQEQPLKSNVKEFIYQPKIMMPNLKQDASKFENDKTQESEKKVVRSGPIINISSQKNSNKNLQPFNTTLLQQQLSGRIDIQAKNVLSGTVVEVYQDNFFQELDRIASLVQIYNFIGMDTEFPGDVFDGSTQYLMVRENVNNLKLIQLGITLSNEEGEYPEPHCTWQFNFKFDLKNEKWNESSINLLKNSGINFEALALRGINHDTFAEYFISSGLIMNKDIHWYGFHTDHDFAYLMRILSGNLLSPSVTQFLSDLTILFPNFYDIKQIADQVYGFFKGSLTALSEKLGVTRDDNCEHQAGSDSKITSRCFIELLKYCKSYLESYSGEIYGINSTSDSHIMSLKEKAQDLIKQSHIQNQLAQESNFIFSSDFEQILNENIAAEQLNMADDWSQQYETTYVQENQKSSSFLTMHPGLAAQFSNNSANQNYQEMTLLDPYQQAQDQNLLYQQQLQKYQNVKSYCYDETVYSEGGYTTPTTQNTPSPQLHSMYGSPQNQYQTIQQSNSFNNLISLVQATGSNSQINQNYYQGNYQAQEYNNDYQNFYQYENNNINQQQMYQKPQNPQMLPTSLFDVYKMNQQ